MDRFKYITIEKPFTDQKPGTSGLRKSTLKFQEAHYLEIFVESVLRQIDNLEGSTLILGGDGRYGNKKAIQKIIQICAAHNVGRIIITKDGILSTPAASNLIRQRNALLGIILSASHNPGGVEGDFGIKINVSNGGPAPEKLTNQIYRCSQSLLEYKYFDYPVPEFNNQGSFKIKDMIVEIIDGVEDYVTLMERIFDLDQIGDYLKNDFSLVFDAMNAVTGPYVRELFINKLGLSENSLMNSIPLPDFGNLHPDPNLTYAHELADLLLDKRSLILVQHVMGMEIET